MSDAWAESAALEEAASGAWAASVSLAVPAALAQEEAVSAFFEDSSPDHWAAYCGLLCSYCISNHSLIKKHWFNPQSLYLILPRQ